MRDGSCSNHWFVWVRYGSEVIAVCRPKSQLLYSYENSFWFADRELFSCSKLIVSDDSEIARTFFVLFRSVTRSSDPLTIKLRILDLLFSFLPTFVKPPFLCDFRAKMDGFKKKLRRFHYFTISPNYKHILRSNDRIFSFLLGFMVRFSRRCTVSLSLKNTSKINCAAFFLRGAICYCIL